MIDARAVDSVANVYEIHEDGRRIIGFSKDFRFEFEAEIADRRFAGGINAGRVARLDVVRTGDSWAFPIAQFCGNWILRPNDSPAVESFVNQLVEHIDGT